MEEEGFEVEMGFEVELGLEGLFCLAFLWRWKRTFGRDLVICLLAKFWGSRRLDF